MAFAPSEFDQSASPRLHETIHPDAGPWTPIFESQCSFNPKAFYEVMSTLIRNPNINSSWLFRADILFEHDGELCDAISVNGSNSETPHAPRMAAFEGFALQKILVRRLIPRNEQRDKPLEQTCLIYHSRPRVTSDHEISESASGDDDTSQEQSLVVYIPHLSSPDEVPFYHPVVQGIGFLHTWDRLQSSGSISIHFLLFPIVELESRTRSPKIVRTALSLLTVIHKHGTGKMRGYVKRVHHDNLVPQANLQNRYADLKRKHARRLIKEWAEVTDPEKHVFEDLGIASFLIELWEDMYSRADRPFPGFVDIGCGNGLLVHILNLEGFYGWGFDARPRKSWEVYRRGEPGSENLRQKVLVPSLVEIDHRALSSDEALNGDLIHDGIFPRGTFIISNHADELTPWTPLIATHSDCPFMMIPCCSHSLTGARYRAPPPPKDQTKSGSMYSSLVYWVAQITIDCGWEPETEMLRIPSTRNAAIIGRRLLVQNTRNTAVVGRERASLNVDLQDVIKKYGGTKGYYENVIKLLRTKPRGH